MPRIFNTQPQEERRQRLRRDTTVPESIVWNLVRARRLDGVKFRRQFGVGPYITDFYAPKHRLVIEIDGDSHFTPEGLEYDKERSAYLEGLGLKVLRFTNAEVRENVDGIAQIIREALKASPRSRTSPIPSPS